MLTLIGDVEIWRILESVGPFLPPRDFFPAMGTKIWRSSRPTRRVSFGPKPGGCCCQSKGFW